MIFSCWTRKCVWFLLAAFSCCPVCFAQSQFPEVAYTPYDHQMERIQQVLSTPSGHAINGLSFTVVNGWMIELRAMPYHYSREWRTPAEVEAAKAADCKGKALALYDWMQLNGATNLRFVIGKRRTSDSLTHAWLEWRTKMGTILLDPTFNWMATIKVPDRRNYIAFYGYERAHKFQAADSLLVTHTPRRRSPVIPSQGVIIRPVRSTSNLRSSPWLFAARPVDPRFFSSRPTF